MFLFASLVLRPFLYADWSSFRNSTALVFACILFAGIFIMTFDAEVRRLLVRWFSHAVEFGFYFTGIMMDCWKFPGHTPLVYMLQWMCKIREYVYSLLFQGMCIFPGSLREYPKKEGNIHIPWILWVLFIHFSWTDYSQTYQAPSLITKWVM